MTDEQLDAFCPCAGMIVRAGGRVDSFPPNRTRRALFAWFAAAGVREGDRPGWWELPRDTSPTAPWNRWWDEHEGKAKAPPPDMGFASALLSA